MRPSQYRRVDPAVERDSPSAFRRLGRGLLTFLEHLSKSGGERQDDRISALEREVARLKARTDRMS